MDITHYFLHFSHSYTPKNQLENAAAKFFKSLDGTIIEASMLTQVQVTINTKIEELNLKFKRCTSLSPKWGKTIDRYDLQDINNVTFYIRPGQLVKFFTP